MISRLLLSYLQTIASFIRKYVVQTTRFLNAALTKISSWCAVWQMKVNEKKTVAMTATRKRLPLQHSYSINGQKLLFVNTYKYLGVVLSADFKWNEHVAHIEKKALQKLAFLRRSLRKSTPKLKLIAYKTFIRPILEYSSVVWDPHSQVNVKTLEMIQRKAIRFVYNRYSALTSPSELLKKADLDTLQARRQHERLKYMFLLYHDKLRINKDAYIETVHRRSTRSEHPKKTEGVFL